MAGPEGEKKTRETVLSTAAMNFFIPGLGYLLEKRFAAGCPMLVASLVLCGSILYLALSPIFRTMYGLLKDDSALIETHFHWGWLISAAAIFLALWIFSFLEPARRGKGKKK